MPKFLANYAGTGVRFFFVISGYLITTILLDEHAQTSTINLRQFYIRRAYRILPAAAVFMLYAFVVYWHDLRWYDVGAMLLYVTNFDGARPWMVAHLWSLGVEEQFYFLWPSVLRKWYRQSIPILLGVIVLAPIYSAACYHFKVPSGGYGTFPAVADNLATGCLLAIFGSRIPRVGPWAAFAICSRFCSFRVIRRTLRRAHYLCCLCSGPSCIARSRDWCCTSFNRHIAS